MPKQPPHPLVASIVAAIEAEMGRQGLNRLALATKAGVPATTVTRLLSGERPDPALSTVIRLADALGVGLADLIPKRSKGQ